MKYRHDTNTGKIRNWLGKSKKNIKSLTLFLEGKGVSHGVANALSREDSKPVRKEIVKQFKIK
jgi:hypothetical protein